MKRNLEITIDFLILINVNFKYGEYDRGNEVERERNMSFPLSPYSPSLFRVYKNQGFLNSKIYRENLLFLTLSL